MGRKERRQISKEFKAEAVRLVVEQKQTSFQVAKDLDVSPSGVAKWVRQAKIDAGKGPAGALTSEERGELGQLRRENRTLKMERELLKKWAAFFAKESA